MIDKAFDPLFSLIILGYERDNFLRTRLGEIMSVLIPDGYNREKVEYIFVDNGSQNKSVYDVCLGASKALPNGVALRFEENLFFSGGFNKAAGMSTGKNLILLSSDVEIRGNFFPILNSYYRAQPDALICDRFIDWNSGWNNFGGTIVPYPEGYFLSMSREVWEKIGGFDELFNPYDFEDVDLGMKCAKNDIPIIQASGLMVRHTLGGTIPKGTRREHTIGQRAKFAKKWGLPNVPERP